SFPTSTWCGSGAPASRVQVAPVPPTTIVAHVSAPQGAAELLLLIRVGLPKVSRHGTPEASHPFSTSHMNRVPCMTFVVLNFGRRKTAGVPARALGSTPVIIGTSGAGVPVAWGWTSLISGAWVPLARVCDSSRPSSTPYVLPKV